MSAQKTSHSDKINFLQNIRSQQAGFSYGKPQRIDEKSLAVVLPILRPNDEPRLYTTFPETEKVVVSDIGVIDKMKATNTSKENVFIRSGTIFTGKTQSRALQHSVVLMPLEMTNLNVRCVHMSHGIAPGSVVSYGGVTPLDVDKDIYSTGYSTKGQGAVWQSVTANTSKMYCMSAGIGDMSAEDTPVRGWGAVGQIRGRHNPAFAPDNLTDNFKNFAKNFESVLAKVKRQENEVGLALLSDKGVETVELFDHPCSWKALHEAAIKRLGPNLAKTDTSGVFDYKPEKVVEQVNQVLALPFTLNLISERLPAHDDPHVEVYGMTADNYVGEMVLVDDTVIHLVILKSSGNG